MFSSGRKALLSRALAPVDISGLVYFRVVFGLVMVGWVVKYWTAGLIDLFYIAPSFHFSYYGFEWVEPLPGQLMYGYFAFLGLCALLIAAGCLYRIAAALFAVAFTYLFLIDKSLYQNHYYLILLLSWIMVVLPVDRAWSVDAWWRRWERCRTAPAWSLWLIRFQIGVPYFFGGVAKLNSDWLQGQPMRTALAERSDSPLIGQFLAQEWCLWLFVYGGLLFDLLIVLALLWRPTRPIAFVLALTFHVTNAVVFNIGVFPWLMIVATAIFFPPDWPGRLLQFVRELGGWGRREAGPLVDAGKAELHSSVGGSLGAIPANQVVPTLRERILLTALSLYVIVQVVLPLRHLFTPGDPSWTEEGHYFAWHMMLRGKRVGVRYYATNPDTGDSAIVDLRPYVSEFQAARFGRDPRMIHQLARKIAADHRDVGIKNVEVRSLALVSLNGRKPQAMIDPRVDLGNAPVTWQRPEWIVPLTEPLRDEAWDVPLVEWERHVDLAGMFDREINTGSPAPRGATETKYGEDKEAGANERRS